MNSESSLSKRNNSDHLNHSKVSKIKISESSSAFFKKT